ncbi:hypothetical protein GCM10023310_10990 [Paenibacillus vulneris]|nr:uncharacterized membrane protein YidH (DUF202 family) [Paenibacillus sp. OAS669]
MLYNLLIAAAIICVAGLFFSVMAIRKQNQHEYDKGMNSVSRKHNIVANPALIAYILFPVAVVILALLFIYYGG